MRKKLLQEIIEYDQELGIYNLTAHKCASCENYFYSQNIVITKNGYSCVSCYWKKINK